jgi:hypothetical protein
VRIYRIGMYENPTTDGLLAMKSVAYAYFSVLGKWVSKRDPCNACGWHWQELGPPLLIGWEPSADVLGDFSWNGPFGYTFLVKEHAAARLRDMQVACDYFPVEYTAPIRAGSAKCVAIPYVGPQLTGALCQSFVELDMHASEVTKTKSCSVCGWLKYSFRYDGIVIRERDWHGENMFRITTNGRSEATFVTEHGREMIEREQLTNIAFSEAGEIMN